MRWIVAKSLRFRFIVVALAVTMMVVGVGQLRDMPVDVFPEFAPPGSRSRPRRSGWRPPTSRPSSPSPSSTPSRGCRTWT